MPPAPPQHRPGWFESYPSTNGTAVLDIGRALNAKKRERQERGKRER